jgi:uncharacterized protein
MQISQQYGDASYVVRAYDDGAVTVNNTTFTRSLIIMPEHLDTQWEPQYLEEVTERHLEPIVKFNPEVVLFGTGVQSRFPELHIQTYFVKRGIGIEIMNTAAACRTYNILIAEGRNVACALLMR